MISDLFLWTSIGSVLELNRQQLFVLIGILILNHTFVMAVGIVLNSPHSRTEIFNKLYMFPLFKMLTVYWIYFKVFKYFQSFNWYVWKPIKIGMRVLQHFKSIEKSTLFDNSKTGFYWLEWNSIWKQRFFQTF